MKWENRGINVVEWANISMFPLYYMELGENVVLRLMECLTPSVSFDIFMDNYFTSFRLLRHLGVNTIRPMRVPNKNRLRKCSFIGDKQKKGTCTSSKKSSVTLTLVG